MDKRYQVFISSTFEDLQEERKEVMQALLELECIPAGMELFPASNEDQWSLIKRVIDDCDYYLLIIGGRYGSLNSSGISYTQMEFEYTLETNKPIISFLPKKPDEIIARKCETSDKGKQSLEAFKKMTQEKMVKYWSSRQDLGSVVSRSMIQLTKNFPAVGWVKSDSAIDETSMKEILRLQEEIKALHSQLNKISTQPPPNVENLSQGEEEFIIHFTYEYGNNGYNSSSYESSLKFTWNELFTYVAPDFIDECNEYDFANRLVNLIRRSEAEILESNNHRITANAYNFKVDIADFNTIKVQFMALGLIVLSEKKRSIKDRTDYWTLTPYGKHLMTQLIAIKKEN